MEDRELVERLLAQNERLIEVLAANQPVDIVRALNPPVPSQVFREPWQGDQGPREAPGDLWGEPEVSTEALLAMGTGWVGGDGDGEAGEPGVPPA